MKIQRLAIALTGINLVLLLLTLAQAGFTAPQSVAPILRGRTLELVDDQGQLRARLHADETGEVVLKLLDKNGAIRVKLGAAEGGSGLVLADEATEPAIHIIARRKRTSERPNTTSITLRGADGQQRVIRT